MQTGTSARASSESASAGGAARGGTEGQPAPSDGSGAEHERLVQGMSAVEVERSVSPASMHGGPGGPVAGGARRSEALLGVWRELAAGAAERRKELIALGLDY